jgi:hypothetical protein
MPAPDPLSRLLRVAADLDRFADALEERTDLDARAFRAWSAELADIARTLSSRGGLGPGQRA